MALHPEQRVHGGLPPHEARAHAALIDFSVNLNPYGPCLPVLRAARGAALDAYPDPLARAARAVWASRLGTSVERIAVGHGAADLFWAITRALLRPEERVVIAEPTFSELGIAAQAARARVERVVGLEQEDFRLPLDRLAHAARGAKLVYLCSPNNPTGEYVPIDAVRALARELESSFIVLDQSFLSLSEHAHDELATLPDNVICVRSLTKDFAMAGLRLGLLVGERELVRAIEACRPTWSVSAPALAAIEAAAAEQAFVASSWRRMRGDREAVRSVLVEAGL
jgi:histidinol-phosphate aminotransferase/threonine-phosphate decarboxylase